MTFSAHIEEKLSRYREFFTNPHPGQLLITIPPYTFDTGFPEGLTHRAMNEWQPFTDAEEMAEHAVKFERHFLSVTRDVGCDYIPSVSPGYGTGVNSAFFSGMPVLAGVDTSWSHPVLDDWSKLDALEFNPDNPWVDYMRRFMRRAADLCDGDYTVGMLASFAPSDMANGLRGNQLFLDLIDEPEQVDRLLSVSADATIALYRELKPLLIAPGDGFVAGGLWMPGDGLYLSEDNADLCSPQTYRDVFSSHTQRVIDEIGGAYVHHHAYGWKVHAEIAKLRGLRFLEFSWDPNRPRPVDHLDEVMAMSGDKPIQIRLTLADLKQYIHQLKQGRFAVMVNVDTLNEAKEAVRLVRKHSII